MNIVSLISTVLFAAVLGTVIYASIKNVNRIPWIIIGIILGIISLKAYDLTTPDLTGRQPDPVLVQQMFHLRESLISYQLDFGEFPVGTNSDIVKSLGGRNPKTKKYYNSELMVLNDKGEFVDTWGNPFRIIVKYLNCPIITSAGKNRKFEGDGIPTDDLAIAGSREDVRVSIFGYFPHDRVW